MAMASVLCSSCSSHQPQAAPESCPPVLVPLSGKLCLLASQLPGFLGLCFVRHLPLLAHPGFSSAASVMHVVDALLTLPSYISEDWDCVCIPLLY